MTNLIIYRNAVEVASVSIDEKTVLTKKLMNEDKITSTFFAEAVLPLELGDYVVFNGKNYYLNTLPGIEKQNNKTYKYTLVFQSVLYDLYAKLLISSDGLNDFSYVGTAQDFLQLIVDNMNQITTGWAVGTVDESTDKALDFINESCRTALTKVSEAFQFEFELVGKTINLKRAIGTVKNFTFQYGRNNGLYSIERRQVDNKSVFTKVYGFGGTKNIPYTYRDRAKRLVFEERFLTKNIDVYGTREGHYTNDDIYPQRTGTLTAANIEFTAGNYDPEKSYVTDTTIDFDINTHLLEGVTAKIVFKTGNLSGSEFEIWKYDKDNKRIYFNPFTDGDGYPLPNESYKPKAGDTYTLVDIEMPYTYIIDAERRLKEATQVFIDENCVPKSLYFVKIDSKYAKANSIVLDAGDLVKIVDAQLGIDRAIRIAEVSFPLVNPFEITAIIADFIPYTLQQLVTKSAIITGKEIRNIYNKITTNVSSKTVVNNYTAENPAPNEIMINGRPFKFIKHFDNIVNPTILEPNDIIYGNFWDRFTQVKKWQFKGGNINFIENYTQIETIDWND